MEEEIKHAVMLLRKNGFSPLSISATLTGRTAVKISMELMIDCVPSTETLKKKTTFENSWMEEFVKA